MTNTISLTDEQTHKARELLEVLDEETVPKDLLSTWTERPETIGCEYEELGGQYVSTEKIIGTEDHNVDRLVTDRLREIIDILIEGSFEKEHRFPPVLSLIDGNYYVSNDGNHRTIAFKYLGIDEIYAEVVRYY